MPKSNVALTNFSAGEVSPLLRGRVDTQKYANGAEELSNFIVTPQGPIRKRPGAKHIGDTYDATGDRSRFYRFQFSNTDICVLEFSGSVGGPVIRIWRNEILLATSANQYAISGVTNSGSITRITTAAHAYNGQTPVIYVTGVVGFYSVNEFLGTATGASTTTFEIPRVEPGNYSSGGTVDVLSATAITVSSPYQNADLDMLYFAQSADVIYICHPYYQTRKLTRTSALSWSIATLDQVDGPYMSVDSRNISMTLSGVTDTATMTATTGTPFIAGDVNEYVEWNEGGVWRLAQVTAYTSTSVVTVDVIDNTLVDLDPNIELAPKPAASDVSRGFNRARGHGNGSATSEVSQNRRRWGPVGGGPVGFAPNNSGSGVIVREGIDPGATITSGAGIASTHANTFTRNDIGKYIRVGVRTWRLITGVTDDKTLTAAAAVTYIAGAPAPETLVVSNRAITATLTAGSSVFASTDVGRHIRLNYNGIWIWGKISGYTSATVVTLALYAEPPTNPIDNLQIINHGRTSIWRLGSWSDTTGWPRTVSFHEQRLVFGGTRTEPQALWFSRSADFENFSPTEPDSSVLDDNGIAYTLASGEANSIAWLQSATVLLIGTTGGEWQARAASSVQEPITPTNISITPQTQYGSIDFHQPIKIGSSVLFIQRSGTKLIELSYSFELDGWVGRDLTVASEHILKGSDGTATAKELAWCAEPFNLLWVRLSDGTLSCLTYNKDQEVLAWHRHAIGGTNTSGTTLRVHSITSAPAPDNTSNRLYLGAGTGIIGASTVCSTLYLWRISPDDTAYADGYEDVALTGVTTVSVAARFLGTSNIDVNSTRTAWVGKFTSTQMASSIGSATDVDYYGWNYTASLKLLPLEGGSPFGTSQGKVGRVARSALRVYASSSFFHGPSASPTVEETFSSTPFTGDKEFIMNQDYGLDNGYYITQSKSLPLTILGIWPQQYKNE